MDRNHHQPNPPEDRSLALTALTPELHSALLDMAADYHAAGEQRYLYAPREMSWEDYAALLRRLESDAHSDELPPGRVPQTVFWLVRNGTDLIGSSRLRHNLTPLLEQVGGHIGYDIRPSERGKGYATRLLQLTLEKAREFGLSGVLVTCDDDNIASAKVIERNNGRLLNKVTSQISGQLVLRYWIDL